LWPQHPERSSLNDVSAIGFAKQQKINTFEDLKVEDANLLRGSPCTRALALLVAGLFSLGACHRPQAAAEAPSEQQSREERAAQLPESTQRHRTYLNRIRQADALNTSIDRTLVNDQNQLGFVLSSSVTPDKVPALMRTVMTGMAQEFPREDLTLTVYAASTPPYQIGTAHLDGQSGKTTYTPKK
jgi:uncharacterized ParB-like nuclease family protein